MTKKELLSWIESQQNQGNSIPMFTRGGGLNWIRPDDNAKEILYGEDYLDEVIFVDEEYKHNDEIEWIEERFTSLVGKEEFAEMTVVCVPHDTGWNQENFDMLFCIWDYK